MKSNNTIVIEELKLAMLFNWLFFQIINLKCKIISGSRLFSILVILTPSLKTQLNKRQLYLQWSIAQHPDHDYCVKSPESHESQLRATQACIKELEKEVIKLKAEPFGLARFGYDNKMTQFYTGFKSARLLCEFIKFVNPTASLMKTWSQVQNRSKLSNSTSPSVQFIYFTYS